MAGFLDQLSDRLRRNSVEAILNECRESAIRTRCNIRSSQTLKLYGQRGLMSKGIVERP
jgi:hypothetical protein